MSIDSWGAGENSGAAHRAHATTMMTSSNENISALLALCAGNSLVTGEFPSQRLVTQSFGVFFDLRLNKRLSKQSWGWWFETRHRAHYDVIVMPGELGQPSHWTTPPPPPPPPHPPPHPHPHPTPHPPPPPPPPTPTPPHPFLLLGPYLLTWFNFNPSIDGIYIYHENVWDEITYPLQTSTMQTMKSGNGQVVLPNTLLGVWLLIYAGI